MPPKNRKKVIASSGLSTRGQQKKAIADSGDESEHLAVEAEDP